MERPSRAALVATAGEIIGVGSRSFAAASRLLDRTSRERAWLLYAWCRACDDLADGQLLGQGDEAAGDPAARLAAIRERTDAVLAGEWVGDPAFDGLRFVVAETGMPRGFIDDLVAGFALDTEGWRPRSEDDLHRYCYHVAGTVGCMMAVVMGADAADADTLDRASDLGIAFQLANISRDIGEDHAMGRCYLPEAWLAEQGIARERLMDPAFRPGLVVLAARLVERAAAYEASARVGTRRLGFRAGWAALAAARIYGGIGRKVTTAGGAAWERRISTSAAEKLSAIGASWWETAGRERLYRPVPRPAGLWTRPRS
ncbi:phytoene/squalene synthase family protein [Sphingomonas sp. DT-204]|uniref:phytoene/squalene synthase family protein n=1 Tax=Sphingomonas sp. DT-204 TaxID=3396166 RepID=UPI003F1A5F3F